MWQPTDNRLQLYNRILDFLEEVYIQRGEYQQGDITQESAIDVLILNFVKIVNDCRAVLLLAQSGFYIQAGILIRSIEDACNLMMHICFEGEDAELVDQWLAGRRVTHWNIVERLNENLEPEYQLDINIYRQVRRRLDDFVHANYDALRLYPAQSPGSTPLDNDTLHELTFWSPLMSLFFVSCLLTVELIVPDLADRAELHLNQLQQMEANDD